MSAGTRKINPRRMPHPRHGWRDRDVAFERPGTGLARGRENLPAHANLHYPMIENFVDAVEGKAPLQSSGSTAFVTDWITEQARAI